MTDTFSDVIKAVISTLSPSNPPQRFFSLDYTPYIRYHYFMVTTDHIVQLFNHFSISPLSIEKMNDNFSTTVWRIKTSDTTLYLRYHEKEDEALANLFEPEAIALEQVKKAGARVPGVVSWNDDCSYFPRPFIILSEVKGTSLTKDLQDKTQIESVLYEAGRDLALINSVKTIKFGYCNDRQTKKNQKVTGNDNSWYDFIKCPEQESLVLFQKKGLLTEHDAHRIQKAFAENRNAFSISTGYLAHGDFDFSHIFHTNGKYSGIIDFGDKRSFDPVYDLAHFNMYEPKFMKYVKRGWIERVIAEDLHPELDLQSLDTRIQFYTLAIALNKGSWIIRYMQNPHPERFVKSIMRCLVFLEK